MTTKFRIDRSDVRKGRAAVATTPLASGARLLSADAYAAVSLTACNWCFSSATASLRRCGGCQLVQYCGRQCQQLDWTRGAHGKECAAWKRIPRGAASQTVLLVARLAAQVLLEDAADGQAVLELRHHHDDHTPQKLHEFTEMTQLVVLMLSRSKFPRAASLGFDALLELHERSIVELFCRINCNAFTICDAVNTPVGIGMFPQAALLNHSCEPNCVVSFEHPRKLQIQVISRVEPGEELTISYVELLESTQKRRTALRASYFFGCACSRCVHADLEPLEDWVLDGFVCKDASCGGVVVVDEARATCKTCGHESNATVIQDGVSTLDIAEKELSAASTTFDQWASHQKIWRIVDEELRCHPRSTRYASAARAVGNFLIDHGEQLQIPSTRALQFLQKEHEATAWLLPRLALPSRGLLLFQLAKLHLAARDCEKAHTSIREALALLSIAYGSGHGMVLTANQFLQDLQAN